jgi:hypothetical protein
VAGLAGTFFGLLAGGLLATVDWRLVFLINVPVGIFRMVWSYWTLREQGERVRASIDWVGNLLFAVGLRSLLIGVTYGTRPYGGHAMGWTSPFVLTTIIAGGQAFMCCRSPPASSPLARSAAIMVERSAAVASSPPASGCSH